MRLSPNHLRLCRSMAAMSVVAAAFAATATRQAAAEPYVLSGEEREYDCKKLTGRMQVRILEVRDYTARDKSTKASHGLQSVVTGILGGSKRGTDPDGDYARDVAKLQAYNQQLVTKGCKSFDLSKELQPKPVTETPTPTVAPAAAKKAQ